MKCIYFIMMMAIAINCSAQEKLYKQMVYGQLLGNGIMLSVNYERQILTKIPLQWHIGVGSYVWSDGVGYSIPTGLKYLFPLGKNVKTKLDVGLGVTYSNKSALNVVKDIRNQKKGYWFFVPNIGIRNSSFKKFIFSINLTPIIGTDIVSLNFFGISLGKRF